MSARIVPPIIGLGLLEAIDKLDILAIATPDDSNKDDISGKTNQVTVLISENTTKYQSQLDYKIIENNYKINR